ncbi:flagellar assembly protein FliW [Iocasia frigidifontis]|uniref:Flagellar assembly factor FliW n=1 Tax=Iocasia fonsfrigidae TaxID=2682810 RepID=A0A8A7K6F0_9FIRM|nr:flagellar assembly protein FliW [Iocasia fonsfrigidae]QTL96931.1 flagellar assembly protein FliW [Iocasia fonsfrigidae]
MLVETSNFGKIEIKKEKMIDFIEPILGFEKYKRFTIIDNLEDDIFYWLQSLDRPDLSFIMINPLAFVDKYNLSIPLKFQQRLKLEEDSEVVFYTIVVIDQTTGDIRTNLKAPVIINTDNNKAVQLVLDEEYPTRFYLFKADPVVEGTG